MFPWYYVGQFGQLGPLSEDQMLELIESQVITRETFVWKDGMQDWVHAASIPAFARVMAPSGPPPVPTGRGLKVRATAPTFGDSLVEAAPGPTSRLAGGVMQFFIPGLGRLYMGYLALGLLQLIGTIMTCGFLYPWSFIDGILILLGHVPVDGYGRPLRD